MKRISTMFTIIMMLNITVSYAWGPKGHDIVAAIAEQNLTRKAKKQIDKILEGRSMVYYSSWMDNLQNAPNWKNGYDYTKTWHYANVDEGHTYQTMPKHPDGDVVRALDSLSIELKENFNELSDSLKADHLKMIIHLVGDLHCPMHAGRYSDRGGNAKKVKWFNSNTNLHSVWDSKFIESARKWTYTEWCDNLDRTNKEYRKSVMSGNVEEWFNESVEKAANIYDYVENSEGKVQNLSYQFIYDFSPMLEEQLLNAGYRLAYILNTIFK